MARSKRKPVVTQPYCEFAFQAAVNIAAAAIAKRNSL